MTMHVEVMPHPRGQAVIRMDRRASQTHLRKTLNRTLPMCLRNSEGAPHAPSANAPFPLDIRCRYAPDVNDAPFPVDARSTARAFPVAMHMRSRIAHVHSRRFTRAFACVRRASFFAHFPREHAARLDLSLRQNSQILRLSAPPRGPLPRPLFTRRPYSDIVRSHK